MSLIALEMGEPVPETLIENKRERVADTIMEGYTSVEEWWEENGLSAEKAQRERKESYKQQKLESMKTLEKKT